MLNVKNPKRETGKFGILGIIDSTIITYKMKYMTVAYFLFFVKV